MFCDDSEGGVGEGESVWGVKFEFLVDDGRREIVENVPSFRIDFLLVVEFVVEC